MQRNVTCSSKIREGYEACKGMLHAVVSTGKLAKYKNVRKLARSLDDVEL